MKETFFRHVDIRAENTFIPEPDLENPEKSAEDYNRLIKENGIDIQVLGIGRNAHIGFNEPGTSFESETALVELAASTREANARFFDSLDEVATHAVTVGIKNILSAKEIILLAFGSDKAEVVRAMLYGPITEEVPASALRLHPNVHVYLDEDAARRIDD